MHEVCSPSRSFRLPANCRLRKSLQYQEVFAQHKRISNRNFQLLYREQPQQGKARIGIIVSRRVSPKAVNRNRIKRQLREVFRLNQRRFRDLDIVVIALKSCAELNNTELRRSFLNLTMKLEK